MTCIAAVVSNGKVYMGADSAGVNSHEHLQLRKDSKVFKNGEYLIGVSGSWRVNQILKFAPLPVYVASYDPFQLMAQDFLSCIRKRLDGCPDEFDLLMGFRGRLFHVYGTEQVSEEIADYEACGSGAQIARGSLYSSAFDSEVQEHPRRRVELALSAAERFCSGVRGPFNILEL